MTSKIVVNNIESDSGISSVTFTSDIELGTKNLKGHNLESTGIVTAVSFTGSGANLTNLPAGNLSGTLPALDGSNLTGVGASFGNSSVNTSGIITATSFVPTTGQLSHRNIVINGDMSIAQRHTSSTSHPAYGVDRFRWGFGNHSAGTVTASQQSLTSSDTPYTLGFRKYTRLALGQAGTAAANTYINLTYKAEAQDVANSGWNYTSASSYITISFWFRASTNQTFVGEFQSKDGTAQAYTFTFTASGNNTWTKITKTIPGGSNVQIDNDNGGGFDFRWYAFYGTDYSTSGHTLDQWGPYSSSDIVPDMASTWLTAGASTFDVTGVQLEVGPVATPFEHISIAENKRRCYRYCQRGRHISSCLVGTPGTYYFSRGYINLFTPMRATITGTLKAATWNLNRYFQYMTWSSGTNVTAAPASVTFSSLSINEASSDIVGCVLHISISSGSSNSPLPANGPGSNNVYPIEYYDVLLEAEL